MNCIKMTYVGGPTALIEIAGLRLITDPTFDPLGSEYRPGRYVLRKTQGPALSSGSVGDIDIVLLSHDHHFDNLDTSGRRLLARAERVLTTPLGAKRLGGNAVGLANWQSVEIAAPGHRSLRITGTPARHGPKGRDRGPVTGFVVELKDNPESVLYISGDTVGFEGIDEISRRFTVKIAIFFMGAAQIPEVGPEYLTMTAKDAVQASLIFPKAVIVPLHFEGWAHLSESRPEIEGAFTQAGIAPRVRWLKAGMPTLFALNAS